MLLSEVQKYFHSDALFDSLLPVYIQKLSTIHFTPLNVAKTAAQFLAPNDQARVIDIGAGIGKFCVAGSYFAPGSFAGIEQRKNFIHAGNKIIRQLGMEDVTLIHGASALPVIPVSISIIHFMKTLCWTIPWTKKLSARGSYTNCIQPTCSGN